MGYPPLRWPHQNVNRGNRDGVIARRFENTSAIPGGRQALIELLFNAVIRNGRHNGTRLV